MEFRRGRQKNANGAKTFANDFSDPQRICRDLFKYEHACDTEIILDVNICRVVKKKNAN